MSDQVDTPQARQKTVNDIWLEVQREQAAFNKIIRWLVGLLIIAALIAAAAAAVSYFEFRDMQAAHQKSIQDARVLAKLDSGEAARERQNMTLELIEIREAGVAARQNAELVRSVDRAAADGGAQALAELAVTAAKDHAAGIRLNTATAHLVATIIDEADAGALALDGDGLSFLKAIEMDWTSPTGEAAEPLRAIADGDDMALKPYAHSALARLYYTNANNNNLQGDSKCDQSISHGDTAVALGIDAIGPSLWKGECLRKQGRTQEAYRAFARAHDWYENNRTYADETLPMDHIRRVHHGVGTTLIALAARDEADTVDSALDTVTALDLAEQHLRIAADMRVARGEGRLGEVYTAENLGFVAVKREDWPVALDHTSYVDSIVPLAWNLTVRYIAAAEIHQSLDGGGEAPSAGLNRSTARQIACDTERTLAAMRYEYFDEDELRRLLPAKYAATIDTLIARPKAAFDVRQLELEGRAMHADSALPTVLDETFMSELCRS